MSKSGERQLELEDDQPEMDEEYVKWCNEQEEKEAENDSEV